VKKLSLKTVWLSLIILIAISCNTKNADNIEGPVIYNPTFSFPVGTYNLSYDNIFSDMDLPLADTSSDIDSTYLVWFENQFYTDSTGIYDTTIVTYFDFNFLKNDQELVKSIMFRLNYKSELPSDSHIQLYFTNASGIRMDSLFADGPFLIEAADTNTEGFVESAETLQQDIYFDESKVSMLQLVDRLELSVGIETHRSTVEFFKYLARYNMYFQLGIRVELEAEL
jgi:hypothetical protein